MSLKRKICAYVHPLSVIITLKRGITNAMDSSEDDILWESDEKDAEEVQEEYNDPH